MKSNLSAAIRLCADGSLKSSGHNSLKNTVSEAFAAVLLAAFFVAVTMLFLTDPFETFAPQTPAAKTVGDLRGAGGPETISVLNFDSQAAASLNDSESNINNLKDLFVAPVAGRLTDGFGQRRNPFGGVSAEFHPGQDIAAPHATTVVAAARGVIAFSGWQKGYGNVVIINHSNGLTTRSAHLSKRSVESGDEIEQNTKIGEVGSTGRSTGPHLHFEVRLDGRAIDPLFAYQNSAGE